MEGAEKGGAIVSGAKFVPELALESIVLEYVLPQAIHS